MLLVAATQWACISLLILFNSQIAVSSTYHCLVTSLQRDTHRACYRSFKPLVKSEEIEKLLQDDDVTKATERSETYQELLEQGRSEFNQSSLKLHSILKDVADSLLAAEKLTKQQAQRYHVSGR